MKPKNKICIICGRDDLPHFSKKRCRYCAMKSYDKPKTVRKEKENKEELDKYFETLINQYKSNPMSLESGERISQIGRVNICHLFPKRTFKSLSANLDNHTVLTFAEHTRFDDLLDKHDFIRLESEFPISFGRLLDVYNKYKDEMEITNLTLKLDEYLTKE